jgi:ssDNA-binding Zn-finger/Zn-ribbon topoisomerase 1
MKGECLDYVLCKKKDMSIFGIIELENFEKSDNQKNKAEREHLINSICKSAHLRLFYFDVRQDYQGVDIRRLVTGRSSRPEQPESNGSSKTQFTIDNSSYAAFAKQRTCPQCNGEVVTKVAVKGKRIGEKFLMCRKYPYCDYRISMNDKEVIKKIHQKDNQDDQRMEAAGYNDWTG